MKYHLKTENLESRVDVSKENLGSPVSRDAVQVSIAEDGTSRTYHVSRRLLLEVQSDGSLARKPFQLSKLERGGANFFFRGRNRRVFGVGGIGGSVEGTQSEGAVCAPMNGQVVKTLQGTGDKVDVGDIILILEAMKMENEVTAPIAGQISVFSVSQGDTVAPGDLLFSIDPEE